LGTWHIPAAIFLVYGYWTIATTLDAAVSLFVSQTENDSDSDSVVAMPKIHPPPYPTFQSCPDYAVAAAVAAAAAAAAAADPAAAPASAGAHGRYNYPSQRIAEDPPAIEDSSPLLKRHPHPVVRAVAEPSPYCFYYCPLPSSLEIRRGLRLLSPSLLRTRLMYMLGGGKWIRIGDGGPSNRRLALLVA